MQCHALDNPAQFALAGKARFTLASKVTGTRFTYQVSAPSFDRDGNPLKKEDAAIHFVSVLSGPDNTADYRYLGYIRRGVYFHGGAKAKIHFDAPSAKAFKWFWMLSAQNALPDSCEVTHEGLCGRCGRALTVPESVKSGFGPECIGKL